MVPNQEHMRGMKVKTIKSILRYKIDQWLATIEDETVRGLAAQNTIVTGGSIASMLLGEPVNDYDIYFKDRMVAVAVANYYIARFKVKLKIGIEAAISLDTSVPDRIKIVIKSAGIASEDGTSKPYEYFEAASQDDSAGGAYVSDVMRDPGDIQDKLEELQEKVADSSSKNNSDFSLLLYRPVFLSTNAITLSNSIQIVIRFWGDPDTIHGNYDFAHCTNYWQSWDGALILRPAALEALLTRELRYIGSKYPLCSIIRLRKFIARGWTINAGQILKMCMQVSQLDLTSVLVLEDQLTGVDVAYFLQVIDRLKEKDSEKVDYAYLIEIIDRMF